MTKVLKFKKIDYAKINSRRYHYQIFFPENLSSMVMKFFQSFDKIQYTNHALSEMKNDKHGNIPLISLEDALNPENILVECYEPQDSSGTKGYLQKVLLRIGHLSDKYDYSYILSREGFIISAWSNRKNDLHRLTNQNNYYKPDLKVV